MIDLLLLGRCLIRASIYEKITDNKIKLRRPSNPGARPKGRDPLSEPDSSTLFSAGVYQSHQKKLTEPEVAWLAGWLEGEGSFLSKRTEQKGRTYRSWSICATSTDKDVVETVYRLTGVGRMHYVEMKNPKHKDCYVWEVNRRCDVVRLLRRVFPYMHSRRRKRITEMFREIDSACENRKYVQLTEAGVDELRKLHTTGRYSQRALATEFGVHESTVSRIVNGKLRVRARRP